MTKEITMIIFKVIVNINYWFVKKTKIRILQYLRPNRNTCILIFHFHQNNPPIIRLIKCREYESTTFWVYNGYTVLKIQSSLVLLWILMHPFRILWKWYMYTVPWWPFNKITIIWTHSSEAFETTPCVHTGRATTTRITRIFAFINIWKI